MLKFENPALNPFIVLVFAFSFNDALSTPLFNGIPITPVQIAVIYGIFYTYKWNVPDLSDQLKRLKNIIGLYYIVLLVSTLYLSSIYGLDNSFLTVGFNMLWFFRIMPFLAMGLDEEDIDKFFKLFLMVVMFITVPSGLYELITHKHVMSIQYGLSSEDLFYLRGFHIDKLEFASMLATGAFISLGNLLKEGEGSKKWVYVSSFCLCTFLILFSFSTTSIMGMVAGLAIIILYKSSKTFLYLPFFAIVVFSAFAFIEDLDIYKEQTDAYELKYSLNIERYEDRNFRYQALIAASEKVIESPFLGYGVGRSGYVIKESLGAQKIINSHNFIANELLDFGLVGFIPLLIFIIMLYRILFSIPNQLVKMYSSFDLLHKVTIALAAFIPFRFFLYYHRFDQSFYFIWAALIIACYGTMHNRIESLEKNDV